MNLLLYEIVFDAKYMVQFDGRLSYCLSCCFVQFFYNLYASRSGTSRDLKN